jgi:primase-polymerase (primpol)-like protein
MIKETTPGNLVIAENIPEELAERPQWVCWRPEKRDGKLTKVPYQPNGKRASVTDLMTWSGFEHCVMEAAHHFDGVGFVFSSADPFVGLDLDKCRDPESGEIAPWATEILDRVQEGYIEVSPSGTGVHIIVEGSVRDGGRSRKKVRVDGEVVGEIEMYSRGRFFTITGKTL